MSLLGGFLESMFVSAWCWRLFPPTSACGTRVSLKPGTKHCSRALCLPSRNEQPHLGCHDKQVLQPLQQEAVLPFLLQSPLSIEFRLLSGDAGEDLLCA